MFRLSIVEQRESHCCIFTVVDIEHVFNQHIGVITLETYLQIVFSVKCLFLSSRKWSGLYYLTTGLTANLILGSSSCQTFLAEGLLVAADLIRSVMYLIWLPCDWNGSRLVCGLPFAGSASFLLPILSETFFLSREVCIVLVTHFLSNVHQEEGPAASQLCDVVCF